MKILIDKSFLPNHKPLKLRSLLIVALLGLSSIAGLAAITVGGWNPHRVGVDVATGLNTSPLQKVWVMRIDLKNPAVTLYATQAGGSKDTINQTTPAFVTAHPTLAGAINANFFDPGLPSGAHVDVKGLLISQGVVVSSASAPPNFAAQCYFNAQGEPGINVSGTTPSGAHTAVGGDHVILASGVSQGPNVGREPRSAIGVSAGNYFAYLLVIDGRQPGWSDGATIKETGDWLERFGAYNGINLDGGGSSTFVLRNSAGNAIVQNHPSDGAPRPVGANIGVFAPALPTHVEAFALGGNSRLYKKSWVAGGSWSAWASMGTETWVSAPDLCSRGTGSYEVFIRNSTALWKKTWSGGGWSAWASLGAPAVGLTGDPTAVSYGPNNIDVFCRGGDGALWKNSFLNPGWSGWTSWGGQIQDNPDACSPGRNHIDVFYRGTDNHLRKVTWVAGEPLAWADLGEALTSGPGVVSYNSSVLDVFFRGTDNFLWKKTYSPSGWTASSRFNDCANLVGGPDASSRYSGQLEVMFRGGVNGDEIFKKAYETGSAWSVLQNLGAILASDPSTVAW